jgi:NTE family protein
MLGIGSNFLFAETSAVLPSNADGSILLADIPIQYGDTLFRQRILERTKGERTPIGLVLSGGSARAFSHIGVLKYLEEQGIVPDFIISNSMGSIVGLMYAAGMSPDQILEAVSSVSLQSLFDMTFPVKGGLLDSSRFVAKLASILGPELKVEALSLPIMVVTEDLVTKRQVQICEGDFYTVLTAAYALPVYFSPVDYKGHLLIDGGITNIAPIALAYDYADSVIVSTTFYDVDTLNLRNALTILNVSIDISKRREGVKDLKEHLDDIIWIRCDVEDVSFMDFAAVKELAAKGYTSAALQKEKLDGLFKAKDGLDTEIEVQESELDSRMVSAQKSYQLYSHNTQYVPFSVLGLGIESELVLNDLSLLKDDNAIGVRYTLRSGDLVVSSLGGMSFQTLSNSCLTFNPSIGGRVEYYLFDNFRTSLTGNVIYDITTASPVFYAKESMEARFLFRQEKLKISILQNLEMISNTEEALAMEFWTGYRFLFNSGVESQFFIQTDLGWKVSEVRFALYYQTLGDFDTSRSFIAGNSNLGLKSPSLGLFASLYTSLRFALDGKGDVPFFSSDQFRTNNSDIRSQGHDLTVSTNSTNYLISVNCTIGYSPVDFMPSFGEMVILENSSISTYFNFLWYKESSKWFPALSMGLELHTDISLLGIRKLPLTVFGGWDQSVDAMIWGFMFNISL